MFGLPEPVTASATPILDSTVLPPAGQRVHGTLITTFVCAVGALVLSQAGNDGSDPRLGAGSVLLSWAFVFTFAILVHELGHLVAGWAVGFRFNSFSVGLFLLHSEYGALKMRLVRGLPFLGMAAMHIKGVRRMRRRLLIMTIAGPGANLLSVPVTVLLANNVFPSVGRSWMSIPAAQFAFLSLLIGMMSLIPIGGMSDGARISMLLTSFYPARRWMSCAALDCEQQRGVRPKAWKRSWLRAATYIPDRCYDDFAANWLAYMVACDESDATLAASQLEKCLEVVGLAGGYMLEHAAMEAAFFTAWFRKDVLTSGRWVAQVKRPKQLPRLLRIRLQTALSCASGDFDAGLAGWREGLDWIDRLPATPSNVRLKGSWLEWQDEIEEQRNQSIARPVS